VLAVLKKAGTRNFLRLQSTKRHVTFTGLLHPSTIPLCSRSIDSFAPCSNFSQQLSLFSLRLARLPVRPRAFSMIHMPLFGRLWLSKDSHVRLDVTAGDSGNRGRPRYGWHSRLDSLRRSRLRERGRGDSQSPAESWRRGRTGTPDG
jgi:hypothetical protein